MDITENRITDSRSSPNTQPRPEDEAQRHEGLGPDGTTATGSEPGNPSAVERTEPATASAGATLAEARRRHGLSVGEVANHLKLSIRQVEALEADAFERLPSPMFVRGFAKSYARLLQIDAAALMQSLDVQCPTDPMARAPLPPGRGPLQPPPSAIPLASGERPSRRLHVLAVLLAAVVAAFLAFEWLGPRAPQIGDDIAPPQTWEGVLPRQGAPNDGQGQPGLPLEPVLVPLDGSMSPPAGGSEAAPVSPSGGGIGPGGDAAPAMATVVTASAASAAAGTPTGTDAAGPVSAAQRTLRLAFDREAWVEIRDARGKLVFSQLNPPGSSQVVQAEAPLSLIVGNARGVRLTDGERPVDLAPYIKVDVARFTLE